MNTLILRHKVVKHGINTYFTPQTWTKILYFSLCLFSVAKAPRKCHVACASLHHLPAQAKRARVKNLSKSHFLKDFSACFLLFRCYLFFDTSFFFFCLIVYSFPFLYFLFPSFFFFSNSSYPLNSSVRRCSSKQPL